MASQYNLCIIKPNKDSYSETFIQAHIDGLAGNKTVLYGGAFPVYDDDGKPLIKSKLGLLSYLIQKRILKKQNIGIRTKALVNYLKAKKITVVLAEFGMVGAMVTDACKMVNVPLVIHYFGADVYHRPTVAQYADLYQNSFKYASALVSVSTDMVDGLKGLGASESKITVIPCGVNTHKYPLLDISQNGPNFLAVGRFVAKKSPASLVKAFALVVKKVPEAKLWMVGQGPLFNETEQLIASLGLQEQVVLKGVCNSDQIKELMKQSRCFVQHSVTAPDGDKEGTPVIILEASSAGLPVVSTRHAGIMETVADGHTGYLVAEHDIEGMADRMITFATDSKLAVQMGKNASAYMRDRFDLDTTIGKLQRVVDKAANAKSH